MKIGIEAQRIFRRNKHGMDYVVLEEIRQLQQLHTDNEFVVFVAPGEDRCIESDGNVEVVETGGTFYPWWEQVTLPRAAKRYGVDLLHCTSNTAPIHLNIPLILTLHDIIFLEPRDRTNHSLYQNMGWFYRRLVVPRILNRCRRIITVSDFERQHIIERLQLPSERVVRIYNGYNDWFRPADSTAYEKYISQPGFFFFLGNTDPKKNTERTLIAYARYMRQSAVKRPLLMADINRQYLDDIISRNHLDDIRQKITVPGYIDNSDLPAVYNAAFAFLYTSLRESFGIPLLEAMACGTPVVTSNTSSMPEIAGADAILTNPADPDAIADAMLRLEQDRNFYNQQRQYGLERVRQFSWRETTTQLLRVYDDVLTEQI